VKDLAGGLNYFFVPLFMIALAAYFVVDLFLQVYDMAVSTIFMCFLEDLQRNDGSKQKPYFMSKALQSLANKYNEDGNVKRKGKKKKKKEKKDKRHEEGEERKRVKSPSV